MTSCFFWCHLQNVRLPVFPALTTLSSLLGKTEINSKSKGAHVLQSFMLAFQLTRSWLQRRKWKSKDIFFLEPLQFWPSQLADDQLIKQVWLAAPGSSKGLFSDTLAQFLLNKDSCHVVDLLKTFLTYWNKSNKISLPYRGLLNRQHDTCSVILLEPDCHHFMVYLFKNHLHVIPFRNQLLFVLGFFFSFLFFYTLMLWNKPAVLMTSWEFKL